MSTFFGDGASQPSPEAANNYTNLTWSRSQHVDGGDHVRKGSSLWENLLCKYRPYGETFSETFGASIVPVLHQRFPIWTIFALS
ncbi:hypothetical protein Tco_1196828 [Tanacetum coccineum]